MALRTVRVEFSDRGGVNIDDIKLYYRYLSEQSRMGMLFNDWFDLSWPVVDVEQITSHPNRMRAGLQLADGVASAFYQALERGSDGTVKPQFAKMLLPRMCQRPGAGGRRYGYGVKVMPTWIPTRLPPDQCDIIKFYLNR